MATDRHLENAFEAGVARIASLLRQGIRDSQIVAVRRIDPHRAGNLADLPRTSRTDLRRIEVALRETAVRSANEDLTGGCAFLRGR